MEHFSLLDFILVSIPEELLIAIFIWIALGKRPEVKFIKVLITSFILACVFEGIRILYLPNYNLIAVIQMISLIVIIYFTYKTRFIEAFFGCLVTMLAFTVLQGIVVNIILYVTGSSLDEYTSNTILKIILITIEFLVIGLLTIVLSVKNIKLLNFKKKPSNLSSEKIRLLFLQLTFSFVLAVNNFFMLFVNNKASTNTSNKIFIIVNLGSTIIFTISIIISSFRVVRIIQKEEMFKRKMDGKEIVQNIHYVSTLMQSKMYDEADSILKSMELEIDDLIINDIKRLEK